jgi:hypothetical protein
MVYFAVDREKATENNGLFQKCDSEDGKYVKKKKKIRSAGAIKKKRASRGSTSKMTKLNFTAANLQLEQNVFILAVHLDFFNN